MYSIPNGASSGEYHIEDDNVRFTNYTAQQTNIRTYIDGELSAEDNTIYESEFGEGLSPFTCSQDPLNLARTVEGLTISHVDTRVTGGS